MLRPLKFIHGRKVVAFLFLALGLSACAKPEVTRDISDPHEAQNRAVFAENASLDRALVRPAAGAYGAVLPEPVKESVGNFASNLTLPGLMVNNLLQGDVQGLGQNGARFVMNTLFGVGGLFDPASDAGLFEDETDFGETLYVWGASEGDYVVLPLLGPSTERHTIGRVVDMFTNPISYALKAPDSYFPTAAKVGARLGDRDQFSDTIDSVLQSETGYEQMRLLYLQNRRFKLGSETSAETGGDVFEELYGE